MLLAIDLSDTWFNGVIGVAGLLIGLFSTALAVYYYLKQRNKKALRYALGEDPIFVPPDYCGEEIAIAYKGILVGHVIRNGILLWNSGDVTIDFENDLRAIRFSVPGTPLLGAYVAKADDQGGGFKIEVDGDTATISFNELRSREGCLFYIHHNGLPGDAQLSIEEKHKGISRRFHIIGWPLLSILQASALALTAGIIPIGIVILLNTEYLRGVTRNRVNADASLDQAGGQ